MENAPAPFRFTAFPFTAAERFQATARPPAARPATGTYRRHRTIFISDTHLGTAGCKAALLAQFLAANHCDTLYLIGDIIDGWQLRRRWHWNAAHDRVVREILTKAAAGTRVVFVPGNHDELFRPYCGQTVQGIEILADCVHRTANGRALLVTHGDQFDSVIACAPWLAHLGDHAYTLALRLNDAVARARGLFGLSYWSLSLWLKHKIKNAVQYIGRFEEAVARDVKARGLDGVVCGHIHHAAIRQFDGILYCNDGDWVESCTALVEDARGNLEILHWASAFVPRAAPARARIRKAAPLPA
ncbi:MAG: UDP-2,3-diacylglucosamine diphosphatase [Alphaproteobacteria bacterium]|mgnify:FL=1|nr:UDP-2,3-diacylglucosamine diphosphatase [Alphaproteobacteria bacterium]